MHVAFERMWAVLEREVFPVRSEERLFNPYRDRDPALDLPGAARTRRENYRRYLASFRRPPRLVLVGEAPGPNGCRFSGIPFTSEHLLVDGVLPFRGSRSSRRERPYREMSATVVWRAIRGHEGRVLVSNVVPLHPHPAGEPLGIRKPTRLEVVRFLPVVFGVLDALRPPVVAAVGATALESLSILGVPCVPVRHPSHGGVREFERGVSGLLADLA